jgi:hypothetical protein
MPAVEPSGTFRFQIRKKKCFNRFSAFQHHLVSSFFLLLLGSPYQTLVVYFSDFSAAGFYRLRQKSTTKFERKNVQQNEDDKKSSSWLNESHIRLYYNREKKRLS